MTLSSNRLSMCTILNAATVLCLYILPQVVSHSYESGYSTRHSVIHKNGGIHFVSANRGKRKVSTSPPSHIFFTSDDTTVVTTASHPRKQSMVVPAVLFTDHKSTPTKLNNWKKSPNGSKSHSVLINRWSRRMQSSLQGMHDQYTEYVSVMVKPRPKAKKPKEVPPTPPIPKTSKNVAEAFVASDVWPTLEGDEFYDYDTVSQLSEAGLQLCESGTHPHLVWKPDKKTEQILNEHGENDSASLTHALRTILPSDTILVWTAKFNPSTNAYGADLPIIRTRGIVSGMSPKDIASLIMDSSRVKSYNKMSLGRTDNVLFQQGIDSIEGEFGDGESKIVVNLTKPPLVKKLMEFRTLMHARKLYSTECGGEDGYILVSRAVPDLKNQNTGDDSDTEENLRSEILMGANLLRSIPENPQSSDLTSVTHVNSPLVHPMVAKKVGMKGAIDFFNDVRAMGE